MKEVGLDGALAEGGGGVQPPGRKRNYKIKIIAFHSEKLTNPDKIHTVESV